MKAKQQLAHGIKSQVNQNLVCQLYIDTYGCYCDTFKQINKNKWDERKKATTMYDLTIEQIIRFTVHVHQSAKINAIHRDIEEVFDDEIALFVKRKVKAVNCIDLMHK